MKAKGLHIGKVMEEINNNFFDPDLIKLSKKKAKGIDQIISAYYIILRAEDIASKEEFLMRRF